MARKPETPLNNNNLPYTPLNQHKRSDSYNFIVNNTYNAYNYNVNQNKQFNRTTQDFFQSNQHHLNNNLAKTSYNYNIGPLQQQQYQQPISHFNIGTPNNNIANNNKNNTKNFFQTPSMNYHNSQFQGNSYNKSSNGQQQQQQQVEFQLSQENQLKQMKQERSQRNEIKNSQALEELAKMDLAPQQQFKNVYFQENLSHLKNNCMTIYDQILFKKSMIQDNIVLLDTFDFLVTARYIKEQQDQKQLQQQQVFNPNSFDMQNVPFKVKVVLNFRNKSNVNLRDLSVILNSQQGYEKINAEPNKINVKQLLPQESVNQQKQFEKAWNSISKKQKIRTEVIQIQQKIVQSVNHLKNIFPCLIDLTEEFEDKIWKQMGGVFKLINEPLSGKFFVKIYSAPDQKRLFLEIASQNETKRSVMEAFLKFFIFTFCE
ncbi:hypothetical protein PPERSA_07427 [Pseudocohnilembus persalinus]|uniref:Uncharacterized protein n=1 Tax=Pseudocohnilembus persalinus TaxID=266149 RepID=A0A0V0QAH5_PSEPJ|nr:hypothetical protein PPERSA_07427 [Pseudocohnilembus persalinus]|eukprot:KRW99184.1 hypothetical protein PPERSA_07427 [Pseudocohnilembus persalinus]